jgi:hypothetical protein
LCRLLSVLNVSNSIIESTAVSWEVEQLFYSKCPKKIQMLLSFSKRVLVHFLVTRVDGTHHVTQCIRHKNFFFHFYSCQHHHRHSKCLCSSLFKCILPAVCVCPTIFSLFFWSNTLQRVFFSNNNNLLLVCTQTAQLNRPSTTITPTYLTCTRENKKD